MASLTAKAVRMQEVRDSLEEVLDRLVERLAIEIPPPLPGRIADPGLVPIMQLERFRDTLVAIETSLVASEHGKPSPNARQRRVKSDDA